MSATESHPLYDQDLWGDWAIDGAAGSTIDVDQTVFGGEDIFNIGESALGGENHHSEGDILDGGNTDHTNSENAVDGATAGPSEDVLDEDDRRVKNLLLFELGRFDEMDPDYLSPSFELPASQELPASHEMAHIPQDMAPSTIAYDTATSKRPRSPSPVDANPKPTKAPRSDTLEKSIEQPEEPIEQPEKSVKQLLAELDEIVTRGVTATPAEPLLSNQVVDLTELPTEPQFSYDPFFQQPTNPHLQQAVNAHFQQPTNPHPQQPVNHRSHQSVNKRSDQAVNSRSRQSGEASFPCRHL